MHIREEQMSKISDNIGIRDLTTCGAFSMRLHFIAKPCSVSSHQCIDYNDCEIVRDFKQALHTIKSFQIFFAISSQIVIFM
jgi:hypothetical protein